jgi:hypothetical protein
VAAVVVRKRLGDVAMVVLWAKDLEGLEELEIDLSWVGSQVVAWMGLVGVQGGGFP